MGQRAGGERGAGLSEDGATHDKSRRTGERREDVCLGSAEPGGEKSGSSTRKRAVPGGERKRRYDARGLGKEAREGKSSREVGGRVWMKHSEEQPLRVRRRCMRGWERGMELGGLREMGGVGDRGRKGCAGACTEEGEARTAGSDGERDRVAGDGALWSRGRVGGRGQE